MNELVNTREDFMFVNVDNVSFQMEKNLYLVIDVKEELE